MRVIVKPLSVDALYYLKGTLKPKLGQCGDAKEKAGEEADTPTYSDKCRERKEGEIFQKRPTSTTRTTLT